MPRVLDHASGGMITQWVVLGLMWTGVSSSVLCLSLSLHPSSLGLSSAVFLHFSLLFILFLFPSLSPFLS